MFCSKCGNEINENATFCGNCGNKIKRNKNAKKHFDVIENFDFKKILNILKEYFLHFYVDYNSKFFKIAMSIFLAIGIGEPLYTLTQTLLPFKIYDLFLGASTLFNFLACALLFGIFSILLKIKGKATVNKSNLIMIFWIVMCVLNLLVFFVGMDMYQYILYQNYAIPIVELLTVVSTALIIFKNKSKYPIILVISALSFALSKSSFWSIKLYINWCKIWKESEYIIDVLDSSKYIILIVILFLLVYIIPKKISKWLVCIPALLVVVMEFMDLIDGFSFISVLSFIINVCIILMFVLFALSCSRKAEYDYIVENTEKVQKSLIKVSIASVSSIVIIVVSYLLISAIVCSMQINSGIKKWESQIKSGELSQWSSMNNDIFKYKCDKFVSQFVDEYFLYDTLKENRNSMEKISLCYSSYRSGHIDNDTIEDYSYINIDEGWKDDPILSAYYSKYIEMQPDIENVSANVRVDVDKGKIEVTINNENLMPISKCTVNCKFTIIFIESGYYSDPEYGRGSRTIEIEDIGGKSKKTETISFNPDDYYDSYGSYILASLMDSSVEIISIE